MLIAFQPKTRIFTLSAKEFSYVFRITDDLLLETIHFGAPVHPEDDLSFLAKDSIEVSFDTTNNRNSRAFEYSDYGW